VTLKKAVSIISWIVLLAAFSSLGLGSESPVLGVAFFAIAFVAAVIGVTMYLKKRGHKHSFEPKGMQTVHKVGGILLLILTLSVPSYIFRGANFPIFTHVIIIVLTAVLVGLAILAISIINNSKGKALGYLLLVVISAVPALAIMQHDSSYNALGMSYYSALMSAIFAWWGISLISEKE